MKESIHHDEEHPLLGLNVTVNSFVGSRGNVLRSVLERGSTESG